MAALKEHMAWSGRQTLNGVQMQVFHVGGRPWGDLPQEVAAELSLGHIFLPFSPLLCAWRGMPLPPAPGMLDFNHVPRRRLGLRAEAVRLRWGQWRAAAGHGVRPPGSPPDSGRGCFRMRPGEGGRFCCDWKPCGLLFLSAPVGKALGSGRRKI